MSEYNSFVVPIDGSTEKFDRKADQVGQQIVRLEKGSEKLGKSLHDNFKKSAKGAGGFADSLGSTADKFNEITAAAKTAFGLIKDGVQRVSALTGKLQSQFDTLGNAKMLGTTLRDARAVQQILNDVKSKFEALALSTELQDLGLSKDAVKRFAHLINILAAITGESKATLEARLKSGQITDRELGALSRVLKKQKTRLGLEAAITKEELKRGGRALDQGERLRVLLQYSEASRKVEEGLGKIGAANPFDVIKQDARKLYDEIVQGLAPEIKQLSSIFVTAAKSGLKFLRSASKWAQKHKKHIKEAARVMLRLPKMSGDLAGAAGAFGKVSTAETKKAVKEVKTLTTAQKNAAALADQIKKESNQEQKSRLMRGRALLRNFEREAISGIASERAAGVSAVLRGLSRAIELGKTFTALMGPKFAKRSKRAAFLFQSALNAGAGGIQKLMVGEQQRTAALRASLQISKAEIRNHQTQIQLLNTRKNTLVGIQSLNKAIRVLSRSRSSIARQMVGRLKQLRSGLEKEGKLQVKLLKQRQAIADIDERKRQRQERINAESAMVQASKELLSQRKNIAKLEGMVVRDRGQALQLSARELKLKQDLLRSEVEALQARKRLEQAGSSNARILSKQISRKKALLGIRKQRLAETLRHAQVMRDNAALLDLKAGLQSKLNKMALRQERQSIQRENEKLKLQLKGKQLNPIKERMLELKIEMAKNKAVMAGLRAQLLMLRQVRLEKKKQAAQQLQSRQKSRPQGKSGYVIDKASDSAEGSQRPSMKQRDFASAKASRQALRAWKLFLEGELAHKKKTMARLQQLANTSQAANAIARRIGSGELSKRSSQLQKSLIRKIRELRQDVKRAQLSLTRAGKNIKSGFRMDKSAVQQLPALLNRFRKRSHEDKTDLQGMLARGGSGLFRSIQAAMQKRYKAVQDTLYMQAHSDVIKEWGSFLDNRKIAHKARSVTGSTKEQMETLIRQIDERIRQKTGKDKPVERGKLELLAIQQILKARERFVSKSQRGLSQSVAKVVKDKLAHYNEGSWAQTKTLLEKHIGYGVDAELAGKHKDLAKLLYEKRYKSKSVFGTITKSLSVFAGKVVGADKKWAKLWMGSLKKASKFGHLSKTFNAIKQLEKLGIQAKGSAFYGIVDKKKIQDSFEHSKRQVEHRSRNMQFSPAGAYAKNGLEGASFGGPAMGTAMLAASRQIAELENKRTNSLKEQIRHRQEVNDGLREQYNLLEKMYDKSQEKMSVMGGLAISLAKDASKFTQRLGQQLGGNFLGMVNSLSGAMGQLFTDLAIAPQDALSNLGKNVLSAFGDMAFQLAAFFAAEAIGMAFTPGGQAAAIGLGAASAALVAIGGGLKAGSASMQATPSTPSAGAGSGASFAGSGGRTGLVGQEKPQEPQQINLYYNVDTVPWNKQQYTSQEEYMRASEWVELEGRNTGRRFGGRP